MPSSPLTYALWFLGTIAPLFAAVCMQRRKLHSEFSSFFTYCLFQVVGSVCLFGISRLATPESYFYAYWVYTALGIGLGFFVIREVFTSILKPYAGLRDAGMLLFRWASVLLIVFSAMSYVSGSGSGMARVVREIVVMERNIRFIQCGLLLFVVLCSNYLNASWKSLASGIAFGFGLFATTDLLISNALIARGYFFSPVAAALIGQCSYVGATVIWSSYALLAPAERKVSRELTYRPVVDRWNQAAMLIMNSEGAAPSPHTYLSDIERTVEAVLAHSGK